MTKKTQRERFEENVGKEVIEQFDNFRLTPYLFGIFLHYDGLGNYRLFYRITKMIAQFLHRPFVVKRAVELWQEAIKIDPRAQVFINKTQTLKLYGKAIVEIAPYESKKNSMYAGAKLVRKYSWHLCQALYEDSKANR